MVSEIVMANKQQAKDIQQVDDAMEQVKEIVGHINTSIHEQDRASSEITRAVESMRALGQEVKRSTADIRNSWGSDGCAFRWRRVWSAFAHSSTRCTPREPKSGTPSPDGSRGSSACTACP